LLSSVIVAEVGRSYGVDPNIQTKWVSITTQEINSVQQFVAHSDNRTMTIEAETESDHEEVLVIGVDTTRTSRIFEKNIIINGPSENHFQSVILVRIQFHFRKFNVEFLCKKNAFEKVF
jgi:hypothetical protein